MEARFLATARFADDEQDGAVNIAWVWGNARMLVVGPIKTSARQLRVPKGVAK